MKYIAVFTVIFLIISCYSVSAVQLNCDSTTADGYLIKEDVVYLDARDAISADTVNTASDYIKIGQSTGWSIYRGFFYFDTSDIPDDVTVQKAWLHFYIKDNPIAIRPMAELTGLKPQAILVADDYNIMWYDLSGVPQSVLSTGWNSVIINDKSTLPSTGSYSVPISKTGITKFAMISRKDDTSSAEATGIMNVYSGNSIYAPYLVVQYNTPPTMPELTGKNDGASQRYYSLSMVSTDNDGESENNKIRYRINWGDGSSEWAPSTGYKESGESATAKHKYTQVGNYIISVKAYDNSGESNDQSGTISKTIKINPPADYPEEESESIWQKIGSLFSWLFPPEDEGPNQRFKSLRARYVSAEGGGRHLAIWWEVNKAANDQNNLVVSLIADTHDGKVDLGSYAVQNHNSYTKPLYIYNWDKKFTGYSTWSFNLIATFVNPTEPEGYSTEDNTITLTYFLGLEIQKEFWYIVAFFIILIIIILILYILRKQIFWQFYLKKKPKDYTEGEINRMEPGFARDWLIAKKEKYDKREARKSKAKRLVEKLEDEISYKTKRRMKLMKKNPPSLFNTLKKSDSSKTVPDKKKTEPVEKRKTKKEKRKQKKEKKQEKKIKKQKVKKKAKQKKVQKEEPAEKTKKDDRSIYEKANWRKMEKRITEEKDVELRAIDKAKGIALEYSDGRKEGITKRNKIIREFEAEKQRRLEQFRYDIESAKRKANMEYDPSILSVKRKKVKEKTGAQRIKEHLEWKEKQKKKKGSGDWYDPDYDETEETDYRKPYGGDEYNEGRSYRRKKKSKRKKAAKRVGLKKNKIKRRKRND
jgi:hypothetical protein